MAEDTKQSATPRRTGSRRSTTRRPSKAARAEQVVRDMFDAVAARDMHAFASCWDAQAVWHNMPVMPVKGRDAIVRAWEGMLRFSDFKADLIAIAGNSDEVVLTERLDHIVVRGIDFEVQVSGTFVIRDGKILENREYWDMFSLLREFARIPSKLLAR